MVICTICLVHIFCNLDFFFSFLHACFLFPLKGWRECHVVFGKMLYGMDVVYKSDAEGYIQLLFWDVILFGQIFINFIIYLEMVSFGKVFKNLTHVHLFLRNVFRTMLTSKSMYIYYFFLIFKVLRNLIYFFKMDNIRNMF